MKSSIGQVSISEDVCRSVNRYTLDRALTLYECKLNLDSTFASDMDAAQINAELLSWATKLMPSFLFGTQSMTGIARYEAWLNALLLCSKGLQPSSDKDVMNTQVLAEALKADGYEVKVTCLTSSTEVEEVSTKLLDKFSCDSKTLDEIMANTLFMLIVLRKIYAASEDTFTDLIMKWFNRIVPPGFGIKEIQFSSVVTTAQVPNTYSHPYSTSNPVQKTANKTEEKLAFEHSSFTYLSDKIHLDKNTRSLIYKWIDNARFSTPCSMQALIIDNIYKKAWNGAHMEHIMLIQKTIINPVPEVLQFSCLAEELQMLDKFHSALKILTPDKLPYAMLLVDNSVLPECPVENVPLLTNLAKAFRNDQCLEDEDMFPVMTAHQKKVFDALEKAINGIIGNKLYSEAKNIMKITNGVGQSDAECLIGLDGKKHPYMSEEEVIDNLSAIEL